MNLKLKWKLTLFSLWLWPNDYSCMRLSKGHQTCLCWSSSWNECFVVRESWYVQTFTKIFSWPKVILLFCPYLASPNLQKPLLLQAFLLYFVVFSLYAGFLHFFFLLFLFSLTFLAFTSAVNRSVCFSSPQLLPFCLPLFSSIGNGASFQMAEC